MNEKRLVLVELCWMNRGPIQPGNRGEKDILEIFLASMDSSLQRHLGKGYRGRPLLNPDGPNGNFTMGIPIYFNSDQDVVDLYKLVILPVCASHALDDNLLGTLRE